MGISQNRNDCLGAEGKTSGNCILEHPDAEFVVVCDKYEDRCQEAAK